MTGGTNFTVERVGGGGVGGGGGGGGHVHAVGPGGAGAGGGGDAPTRCTRGRVGVGRCRRRAGRQHTCAVSGRLSAPRLLHTRGLATAHDGR